MANSPFNYGNIRTGTTQVHQVGEIWAATLWDLRNVVGAAVVEQLVVSGMKLTPCQPTMLQALDGILQADANVFGGFHRCMIWKAFAGRHMGTGASSPNHNSTTGIVPSLDIPQNCRGRAGGRTRDVTAADVPNTIPDNDPAGVKSAIDLPAGITGTLGGHRRHQHHAPVPRRPRRSGDRAERPDRYRLQSPGWLGK
jgi:hypothetical protein